MTARPLLLDLFCGAGGAAVGYHHAGFDVLGVDIEPQPNYPFEFVQEDAIRFLRGLIESGEQGYIKRGGRFAVIHASPPCQRYSSMSTCRIGLSASYPDLIAPTRDLLAETGLPYIIENVVGAPLKDPVMLCGTMFGRELYRHRLFESSVPLVAPTHSEHVLPASKAGHWKPGTVMSVAGHIAPIAHARNIMDIDWTTRAELAEAIPPYYAEYVGNYVMKAVHNER